MYEQHLTQPAQTSGGSTSISNCAEYEQANCDVQDALPAVGSTIWIYGNPLTVVAWYGSAIAPDGKRTWHFKGAAQEEALKRTGYDGGTYSWRPSGSPAPQPRCVGLASQG